MTTGSGLPEQVHEQGRRNHRHIPVPLVFEIFVTGDEEFRSRAGGHEFEEGTVFFISNGRGDWAWGDELGDLMKISQEEGRIHACAREVGLQPRTVQDGFQFGKGRLAHDWDEVAFEYGVDNFGRWAG